jgi:hypothetical protein
MENRSIVKTVFRLLARAGMLPFLLALGEFDEVGNGLRRFSNRRQTMVPSLVSKVA